MVLNARDDATDALEELCQRYWFPLYAFARRRGHSAADAEDLTQEFFSRLLSKQWLDAVDRQRGKFRTFLLMAMKRFLANEWQHAQRLKRGGGAVPLSLDTEDAEARYARESPHDTADASRIYDRQWALTLLRRTLQRLETEQSPEKFTALQTCLTAARGEFDCARAAATLGIQEGAARVAVHRLRKRYREIFREEIAQTIADPSDLEDEVRYLIGVLALG